MNDHAPEKALSRLMAIVEKSLDEFVMPDFSNSDNDFLLDLEQPYTDYIDAMKRMRDTLIELNANLVVK